MPKTVILHVLQTGDSKVQHRGGELTGEGVQAERVKGKVRPKAAGTDTEKSPPYQLKNNGPAVCLSPPSCTINSLLQGRHPPPQLIFSLSGRHTHAHTLSVSMEQRKEVQAYLEEIKLL